MKNSVMKAKMSNTLKVSLLVFFTSLLPLTNASAQSTQKGTLYYKQSGVPIEVGDSVQIDPANLYYRTGERKSAWVYDKVHTVLQVGGKLHPDAILLKEIYSWVEIGSIEPMNKVKQEAVEKNMNPVTDTMIVADTVAVIDTIAVIDTVAVDTLNEIQEEVYVQDTVVVEDVVSANTHRLSIGLRGGFASTMATTKNMPLGFDALLDLRYAHYWAIDQNKPALGIMTGLNIGYVQASQSMEFLDKYTTPTVHSDVDYVIEADKVAETDRLIQLEIPVMFSMVTPKGFFLNVGPKLILPVYSKYTQTIKDPKISAYLPELSGNPIVNEVVMGKLTEEQMDITENLADNPCKLLSLAFGAELGYEFKFKNGHSLDLGVYADYSVYTLYNNSVAAGKVITVTPPTYTSPAIVEVQPMSTVSGNKFAFLDAGLKISYNFDFIK